jgi:hypothetical protein
MLPRTRDTAPAHAEGGQRSVPTAFAPLAIPDGFIHEFA